MNKGNNIYYKSQQNLVWLPAPLSKKNLERIAKENPPAIESFCLDFLAYFLSLIYSIPANNKCIKIFGGYVPIYSLWLRDRIGNNYRSYVEYAIRIGLVESDNFYIKGEKCKGYRFKKIVHGSHLEEYTISNLTLIRRLNIKRKYQVQMMNKYRHLTKWFDSKRLKINKGEALMYINEASYEIRSETNDHFVDHKLNPHVIRVNKIASGEFSLCVDTCAYRFHSNLTNLKKEFRHWLTYDGHQLENVDIVSAQPFLSLRLLDPTFWQRKDGDKITIFDLFSSSEMQIGILSKNKARARRRKKQEVDQLPNKVQKKQKKESNKKPPKRQKSPSTIKYNKNNNFNQFVFFMFQECTKVSEKQPVTSFKNLILNGRFYEHFGCLIRDELGVNFESTKEIKGEVFHIIYGNNYGNFESKGVFVNHFREVADIFRKIKSGDHRVLPIILQRLESKIVLDKATRIIASKAADLPIFTIHDSIMTLQGYGFYVQRILEEEIYKATGYKAKTRIEKPKSPYEMDDACILEYNPPEIHETEQELIHELVG